MISFIDTTPSLVKLDRSDRFIQNEDHLLLHPSSVRDDKNSLIFEDIHLDDQYIFQSQIWLPVDSVNVVFGFSIHYQLCETLIFESVELLQGGNSKKWSLYIGELRGTYTIKLWTEIGPDECSNRKAWARFYCPVLLSVQERHNQDNDNVALKSELNKKYNSSDPWSYEVTDGDINRRIRLLGALPTRHYKKVLDIGCGDGFLTFSLPGETILGVDLSDKAIEWADCARGQRHDADRFSFMASSIFELSQHELGEFDLIVITGVLYPQYIGNSWTLIAYVIDGLLMSGGILAACHIHEWTRHRFPYPRIKQSWYPYRNYTHCLEVFCK